MSRQRRNRRVTVPKPGRGSGNNPSGLPADTQIGLISEQPMYPVQDFNFYSGEHGPYSDRHQYQQHEQYYYQETFPRLDADPFQPQYPQWLHHAPDGGARVLDSSWNAERQESIPSTSTLGVIQTNESRVLRRRSRRLPLPYATRDTANIGPLPSSDLPAPPYATRDTANIGPLPSSDLPAPPYATRDTANIGPHPSSDLPAPPHANVGPLPSSDLPAPPQAEAAPVSMVAPPPADRATVSLDSEMQGRIIERARYIIIRVLFTEDAMVSSKDRRKALVSGAITDATSEFITTGTVRPFVTKVHRKKVSDALSFARNKLISIACCIVMTEYDLFPPDDSVAPDVYRVHIVKKLIDDPQRNLFFMHEYFIDEHDELIVLRALQHKFIVHILAQWIWGSGFGSLINDVSPEDQMRIAFGVAGAAAYCSLCELSALRRETTQFTPFAYRSIFDKILHYIDNLGEQGMAALHSHFRFIVAVGKSLVGDGAAELLLSHDLE